MYKCKLCKKEFGTSCALGGHVRSAHTDINKRMNEKRFERYKISKKCLGCGKEFISHKGTVFCCVRCSNGSRKKIKEKAVKEKMDLLSSKTKGDLFANRKNWQSARSSIRRHAYNAYFIVNKREYKCAKCGYNKYVEVCHIQPVSEFDDLALIGEINAIHNLIGLCPNCHWEFDNSHIIGAG